MLLLPRSDVITSLPRVISSPVISSHTSFLPSHIILNLTSFPRFPCSHIILTFPCHSLSPLPPSAFLLTTLSFPPSFLTPYFVICYSSLRHSHFFLLCHSRIPSVVPSSYLRRSHIFPFIVSVSHYFVILSLSLCRFWLLTSSFAFLPPSLALLPYFVFLYFFPSVTLSSFTPSFAHFLTSSLPSLLTVVPVFLYRHSWLFPPSFPSFPYRHSRVSLSSFPSFFIVIPAFLYRHSRAGGNPADKSFSYSPMIFI